MQIPRLAYVLLGCGIVRAQSSVSFVLTGDSTTATIGGWGDGFCGNTAIGTTSVLEDGTYCKNVAKSGATTGSFIAGGYWATALDAVESEVAKGQTTYVTIQFGHNDQKIATPESMGTNLTRMVGDVREVGGEPVLVTSLTRRTFESNGTLQDLLGPWADETILISEEQDTLLLDLHAASMDYVQAIGKTAAHALNLDPSDNTHLNVNGSLVFARLVADLFTTALDGVDLPIVPDEALSYNISHGIPSY